jgi:hypothetical protein
MDDPASVSLPCNWWLTKSPYWGGTELVTLALPAVHRRKEGHKPLFQGDLSHRNLAQCSLGLVDRAKEGDKQAFLALFEAYGRRIYSLSLRLAGNVAAAENLTRNIFIDAFRSLDAIHDDAAFADRLHCIAVKTLTAGTPACSFDIQSSAAEASMGGTP